MKKILISMMLFLSGVMTQAQEARKFSPEKFQAEMEQFITKEANLTPEEAAKFFPLFREMQQKQRTIFEKVRKEGFTKPVDDATCRKLVERRDACELEQKKIQQLYHQKFFSVISPSKVFDVLIAEERFHRRAFRNWGQGNRQNREHQK